MLLDQGCNTLPFYNNQAPREHAQSLIDTLKAELAKSKENMKRITEEYNIPEISLTNTRDERLNNYYQRKIDAISKFEEILRLLPE